MKRFKVKLVRRANSRNWQFRWIDPVSGIERQKSSGTVSRRDAERLAHQLEADIEAGRYEDTGRMLWDTFRERYEQEKVSTLAEKTGEKVHQTFDHLENLISPNRLSDLTASTLSRFQAKLRSRKISEATVAIYLRHLKAALGWAELMGFITKRPRIEMPKRAKSSRYMRGRAITRAEFDRMLAKLRVERPNDWDGFRKLLEGLWLSGLRLSEALALSWDTDAEIVVDLKGKFPCLRILAEAQKNHQDTVLPITPDFAEFLLSTPHEDRKGYVFKLESQDGGGRMTQLGVSRVITKVGRAANVVVDPRSKKCATAHDLRRTFGSRWSRLVKPLTLQAMMRHSTLQTTLRYYVMQDADEIGLELRAATDDADQGRNPGQLSDSKDRRSVSEERGRTAPSEDER